MIISFLKFDIFKMDSTENVKGQPLTKDETKALLSLIESSKVITTKATNASNNKMKTEEWIRIAEKFNASFSMSTRRTPQQLRMKWENLKKNSRKRSTAIRMNNLKTGGGPPDYIPPDDILERVASLLGSTGEGFTVNFGGDAVIEIESSSSSAAKVLTVIDEVVAVEDGCKAVPASSVNDCEVNVLEHSVLETRTTPKPLKLHMSTPKAYKRKSTSEAAGISLRNCAIADYFKEKKKYIQAKTENVDLQNQKLRLENEKLKLEISLLKNSHSGTAAPEDHLIYPN